MRLLAEQPHQLDAGGDVVAMDRFDDRVCVATGDRNSANRDAAACQLHTAGIGAAARENFHLVTNAAFFGERSQKFHQSRIGNRVAVHDLDGSSLAEPHAPVPFFDARNISGDRDVERDADVRFQAERGDFRTTDTDFLLHGGDCNDRILARRKPLECFDHDVHPDAVVERLAGVEVAHLDQVAFERNRIADAHKLGDLVTGQADVNEHVFERDSFGAFFRCGKVRRLGAEHSRNPLTSVNPNALRIEHTRIESAERLHVKEAFLGDMPHQERNLVHVCGEHDRPWRLAFSLADEKDVAHRIGANLVGIRREFFDHECAELVLPSRRRGSVAQTTQKFERHREDKSGETVTGAMDGWHIRTIAYCDGHWLHASFACGGVRSQRSVHQLWSISTMAHPVPKPSDPAALDEQFVAFVEIVRLLRRHCPWDREQTHESISHLLIEESYETLDAIERGDDAEFKKELGDLLLHVVMHSVIAEERGAFTLRDVIEYVAEKLVRRHPHVFGDVEADRPDQVMQNWERLKMQEGRDSILAGVPKHLPALLRAQRMQEKAAHVGFDWKSPDDVWDKVREELSELQRETDPDAFTAEFGDVLFALVNAARHAGIVAETALQSANDKFQRRFRYIEQQAREQGVSLASVSLEQMDTWWNQAKREQS